MTECHCDFCTRHGCIDHMLTLRILAKKSRGPNTLLYFIFMILNKAYMYNTVWLSEQDDPVRSAGEEVSFASHVGMHSHSSPSQHKGAVRYGGPEGRPLRTFPHEGSPRKRSPCERSLANVPSRTFPSRTFPHDGSPCERFLMKVPLANVPSQRFPSPTFSHERFLPRRPLRTFPHKRSLDCGEV